MAETTTTATTTTAKFIIDGVDFTSYVKSSGMGWDKNDIDAAGSGRNKVGLMKRKRVTSKRKLKITCMTLTQEKIQTLSEALDHETIEVTYLDPQLGETTKTFYGSSISSTTQIAQNDEVLWEGTAFNLTEV